MCQRARLELNNLVLFYKNLLKILEFGRSVNVLKRKKH